MGMKKATSKAFCESATLLILPPEKHTEILKKILGAISGEKVCFVSLGRTYDAVLEDMRQAGISPQDSFVLDCVTSPFSQSDKPPEHVTFIPSPDALTDLNIAIIETLKNENCGILVFDSLSTLLTYRDGPLVARFTDFVVGKVRELKARAIFTCLENDSKTQAISEITIHMDRVAHFEEMDGRQEE